MSHYSFDTVWNRTEGKDAIKWEVPRKAGSPVYTEAEDIIPMWVADMDFATPPCVIDAISARLAHPILGYFDLPAPYIDAVNHWQQTRFGVTETLTKKEIAYQNSVLGAVSSFLQAYTLASDKILIHSPIYTGFQMIIKNLGRTICASPLAMDEAGIYRMDLADMEAKIVAEKISVMIFCSPHNPTGRVWERKEIEAVVALCDKHGVTLISDEIWADFITDTACKHIVTQSVSERAKQMTMAVYAPSKTFNIAGLVGAYSIIYNNQMANKINALASATHYNGANILSCHALIGGYQNGAAWVDEMNQYIRSNQEYVVEFINTHCKGAKAYLPQAPYLLWVDVSGCNKDFDTLYADILATGILPSSGKGFCSDHHLRMNLACPRSVCEAAMQRLKVAFA